MTTQFAEMTLFMIGCSEGRPRFHQVMSVNSMVMSVNSLVMSVNSLVMSVNSLVMSVNSMVMSMNSVNPLSQQ